VGLGVQRLCRDGIDDLIGHDGLVLVVIDG
jgi:hypothetical protein